MAKHVLNNSTENFDFLLIGILTGENQYSIVSKVNQALGIDLVLSDNISYNLKPGSIFHFSLYRHQNEDLGLEIFLLPNNSNLEIAKPEEKEGADLFSGTGVEESARLIKELPKTNYFLIVKGEDLHLFRFKITDKLKNIEEIIQVQVIEPRELPSRMNLVF